MKNNRFAAAALALNLSIVLMEIAGAVRSFLAHGAPMLRYYTEDSNLLSLVCCALYAACLWRHMRRGARIPRWALTLKYVSACCLGVTFTVVVLVLAPMRGAQGYRMMLFSGSMLFNHTLCPLLSMLSFVLLDPGPTPEKRRARLALLPTALYALAALALNLARRMDGPYPFLKVYEQPLWQTFAWLLVIPGGAYLLSVFLRKAREKWNLTQ